MKERQFFPIFDAAYLGFNSGDLDKYASVVRYFVQDLDMEAVVCMSFAKNMGLYGTRALSTPPRAETYECLITGERVGATVVVSHDPESARNCQSVLESLQRSEISNPPAYGAKIAGRILNDPDLRRQWSDDLVTMSSRIKKMREMLFDELNAVEAPGKWEHIVKQSGMFGFLGLSGDIVLQLRSTVDL